MSPPVTSTVGDKSRAKKQKHSQVFGEDLVHEGATQAVTDRAAASQPGRRARSGFFRPM